MGCSRRTKRKDQGKTYGHKIITAETAIELGSAFGVSPTHWLNLQTAYQLYKASQKMNAVKMASQTIARKVISKAKPERKSVSHELGASPLIVKHPDKTTRRTQSAATVGMFSSKKKTRG